MKRPRKRWTLCILLVVAGLAMMTSGCGGSDDSEGEVEVEAGSLTKAEFVDRANAICQNDRSKFEREFAAFAGRAASSGQPNAQAAELVETIVVPIYSSQIDRIAALGAPSEDEVEIVAFLTAIQRGLDDAVEQPLAFTRDKEHFIEAAEQANEYGLTICARALV